MVPSGPSPTTKPIIHSTVRLPSLAPSPSPRALLRSQDGQFAFLTDRDICIVTPQPTFSTPIPPDIHDTIQFTSAWTAQHQHPPPPPEPPSPDGEKESERETTGAAAVKCFQARIGVPGFGKEGELLGSRWDVEHSDDFRALTAGVQLQYSDLSWRTMCWSPSGLNSLGGCLLVAVTSIHDVFVFSPIKDPLSGMWTLIDRLTPKLLAKTEFPFRSAPSQPDQEDDRETWHARRVLDAQTLCLDWSSNLSFERDELEERPVVLDASLLALGHKGGLITFWSFEQGQLSLIHKLRISTHWISSLVWSRWSRASSSESRATLAYTTPSGSVQLLSITRSISSEGVLSLSIPPVEDQTTLVKEDGRPLSGLVWVDPSPSASEADANDKEREDDPARRDPQTLVMVKIGEAILWRPTPSHPSLPSSPSSSSPLSTSSSWSGLHTFRFARLSSHPGSTRLANASGISRLSSTSLAISLADGSHHVFSDPPSPSSTVAAEGPKYDLGQSMFLTEAFRKVFVDVELKAVGKESAAAAAAGKESKLENAVMRIAGVVGLERGSWVWVHSVHEPYDIAYHIHAVGTSTFMIAHIPTHKKPQHKLFVDDLSIALEMPYDATTKSPATILAPFLLPFLDSSSSSSLAPLTLLAPHILLLLSPPSPPPSHSPFTFLTAPTSLPEAKTFFRHGLHDALWRDGHHVLGRLKLRLALATYLSRLEGAAAEVRRDFGKKRDELARMILVETLRIVLEWFVKVEAFIGSDEDHLYLSLVIHAFLSLHIHPPSNTSDATLPAKSTIKTLTEIPFDLALRQSIELHVDLDRLEAALEGDLSPSPPPSPTVVEEGEEAREKEKEREGKERSWTRLDEAGDVGQRCPACREEVLLDDLAMGVCEQGHVWDRCSITFSLISTPRSRKCMSCSRSVLLPSTIVPRPKLKAPSSRPSRAPSSSSPPPISQLGRHHASRSASVVSASSSKRRETSSAAAVAAVRGASIVFAGNDGGAREETDEVELRRRSASRDDTPEMGEEERRKLVEEEAEGNDYDVKLTPPPSHPPSASEAGPSRGSAAVAETQSRRERSTTGEMVVAAGLMRVGQSSGSLNGGGEEEVEAGSTASAPAVRGQERGRGRMRSAERSGREDGGHSAGGVVVEGEEAEADGGRSNGMDVDADVDMEAGVERDVSMAVDGEEVALVEDAVEKKEDWLMDALLEVGTCCLFCGGRFCLPV